MVMLIRVNNWIDLNWVPIGIRELGQRIELNKSIFIIYLQRQPEATALDLHAECPLELVLGCLGLHQVHGEDVLLEVEGAAAVEVEAAEHLVTELLGRELGELSAHIVTPG